MLRGAQSSEGADLRYPGRLEHHVNLSHVRDHAEILSRSLRPAGDRFIGLFRGRNNNNFILEQTDSICVSRAVEMRVGGDDHLDPFHHLHLRDDVRAHLSGANQTDSYGSASFGARRQFLMKSYHRFSLDVTIITFRLSPPEATSNASEILSRGNLCVIRKSEEISF